MSNGGKKIQLESNEPKNPLLFETREYYLPNAGNLNDHPNAEKYDAALNLRSPLTGTLERGNTDAATDATLITLNSEVPPKPSSKDISRRTNVAQHSMSLRISAHEDWEENRRFPRSAKVALGAGLFLIMAVSVAIASLIDFKKKNTASKNEVVATIEPVVEQPIEPNELFVPETTPLADTQTPVAQAVAVTVDEAQYEELLLQAKKARRPAKRIEILRKAVLVNPEGTKALSKLALLLMEQKSSREEAQKLAERAVELDSADAAAWLVIGYVNELNGKRSEAKRAYRECAGCPGPKPVVKDCRLLL